MIQFDDYVYVSTGWQENTTWKLLSAMHRNRLKKFDKHVLLGTALRERSY